MSTPSESPDRERLQEPPFFTLPGGLLDELENQLGRDRFDAQLWRTEEELSGQLAAGSDVGYWRLKAIEYPLLRGVELRVKPELIADLRWTSEQIATTDGVGANRSDKIAAISRAYAGWLLTNRLFWNEHAQLFQKWAGEIAELGVPIMGPVVLDASRIPNAERATEGRMRDYLLDFEAFFVRWRLHGMAAPSLPFPLSPQMPVTVLERVLGHMRHGGQTFYLPDTFPVPSRDELRDILEDALRGSEPPDHLREWSEIVRASNASRNTLPRYARLLELQHYWRAIFQRHGDRLHRAQGLVEQALAAFLRKSQDTIGKDLALIAERLGDNWYLPPA